MTATATAARSVIMAAARSDRIKRTAEKVPVTRNVVHRFVPGESHADVIRASSGLLHSGRMISIDYLGEDTTDEAQADATVQAYLRLIGTLGDEGVSSAGHPLEVSIKLSALGRALPGTAKR